MRTSLVITSAIVLVAAAVAVSANPASAAGPVSPQYGSAMKYFAPQIEAWVASANTAVDAAVVKPELACGTEMAELASQGNSIVADLEGTLVSAPGFMVNVHESLTNSVNAMASIVADSCGQPEGAAAGMQETQPGFQWAIDAIRFYSDRGNEGA